MLRFFILCTFLFTLTCKTIDKSGTSIGASQGISCQQFCQQSESDFISVLAEASGVTMEPEEFQQLCSTAPEASDCLDCWQWLAQELFLPNALSPECFTLDFELSQQTDVDYTEALESCIRNCNDDGLDPFQFEQALNEMESYDSGMD